MGLVCGFYFTCVFDELLMGLKFSWAQIEVRKREEKEAAEALKRDQELREAKRQQQRLNFLLTQTELYSHFMQNKTSNTTAAQASQDALRDLDTNMNSEEGSLSVEDAEEEAALKEEAVRAAKLAAAQQRNRTNDFDSESERLRTAAGGDEAGEGAEDMDLLHPYVLFCTLAITF